MGRLTAGPWPREGFAQGRVHLLGRTALPAASLNTIQSLAGQHGIARQVGKAAQAALAVRWCSCV